jgi:flagellar FliL protein
MVAPDSATAGAQAMMRVLLVLIVAIVFGGAGFGGGWWYFTQFAPPHAEDGPKAPEPPLPSGPPAFVNIGPLTVPVIAGDGIQQYVTLVVAVEVSDLPTADRVRGLAPRLTDAFITSLYGAIADGRGMNGGIVDVPQVKTKLAGASRKVLGEGVARDVLVQVVSQRPL